MFTTTVSEATFVDSDFPSFEVKLTEFDSSNDSSKKLEFKYAPVSRDEELSQRYKISYTDFQRICEVIFLKGMLTKDLKLPARSAIKQISVECENSGTGFIAEIDYVSETVTLGFLSSDNSTFNIRRLRKNSVNYIPFAFINKLNKQILAKMSSSNE